MTGDYLARCAEAWLERPAGAAATMGTVLLSLALLPPAIAEEHSSLAEFVRDAVAANGAVLAAEAALRGDTERQVGAARSYDNPEVSVQTEEIGAFDGAGHDRERRVVIGVAKRLDLHGKRRARMTVAEAKRLVARAELDGVRTEVAAELLDALARWRTASARVGLLATHERTMADFEALAERRRDAGDISRMEANLATLALAETRMRLAAANAEQSMAAEGVRNVTFAGDEQRWPTLDFDLPALGGVRLDSVSALPVVRAALLKAQMAAAEVDVARRDRRPDPTVSLGVGREAGAGLAEIGVSVPIAVLDRGAHAVSAATADATAATRAGDDVARRARVRFEASAERYRIARSAWEEWLRDGAGSLGERESLARRSWEAGELEPADYLVHLDAAMELRTYALDLRLAAWNAWFEWLVASGGLDDWLAMHADGGGM
ncbi:MAG: TolC family protein [Gammaproteobacteria bacterium]|nr:TolC family protein [Gammaproteobacteria bacterium]